VWDTIDSPAYLIYKIGNAQKHIYYYCPHQY
jgi:hypothetical protein